MEITIYGGFNTVTGIMQQIALFFSDSSLPMVFIAMFVAGVLGAGINEFYSGIQRGKSTIVAALITCLLGLALSKVFIFNTGNLVIYDRTSNQHAIISDVPDGLRIMYRLFNTLENFFVERWYTASHHPALDYRDNANGIGFDMFLNASKVGGIPNDPLINRSLQRYWTDCVTFALKVPASNLTMAEMMHGDAPGGLIASFGKAQHPMLQTQFYQSNDTHKSGTWMSCRDSWDNIRPYITNPANFTQSRDRICASAGVDINDPLQLQSCEQKINQHIQFISNGQVTGGLGHFNALMNLARSTFEVTKIGGDHAINRFIQQDFTVKGIGAIMGSSGYMGEARYAMFAIVGAMSCVLMLLWPTPVFGKAFAGIIYLWGFIFFWAIGDAIAHKIAVDRAFDLYAELRATGGTIGINTLFHIPSETAKALGVFGQMRAYSMLVATIITGFLFKVSSPGMAQLGSRIGGAMSDIGSSAAERMMTPGGYNSTIESTKMGQGHLQQSLYNTGHGYDEYSNAEANRVGKDFGQNFIQSDVAEALDKQGLLPNNIPGGNMAALGAAGGSTFRIAADGGVADGAINPDTSKLSTMMITKAGTENPDGTFTGVEKHGTPDLGYLQVSAGTATQQAARDTYQQMDQNQQAAARAYTESTSTLDSQRQNFDETVRNSDVYSRQDREALAHVQAQQGTLATGLAKKISDSTGMDYKDAQSIARALTASVTASASVGTPGGSISPVKAKLEAALKAEGRSLDEETITRALNSLESDDWSKVRSFQETQSQTYSGLAEKATSSSDENAIAAARGLVHSLDTQRQASEAFTESNTRLSAAGQVLERAETDSTSRNSNLSAVVLDRLKQTYGDGAADTLLREANTSGNAAARAKVDEVAAQVAQQEIKTEFDRTLGKKMADVQSTTANIEPPKSQAEVADGYENRNYESGVPKSDRNNLVMPPLPDGTPPISDENPTGHLVPAAQINAAAAQGSGDFNDQTYTATHTPGSGKEEIKEKEEYMRTRGVHYNNNPKGKVTDEQRHEANSAAR